MICKQFGSNICLHWRSGKSVTCLKCLRFFFLRCVCSTHIWRLNDVDGATDQSSVFNTSTVCNYLITVVWAPVRCTHTGRSISTFSFCCCVTLASAVKQNGVDTLILSDLKKKPQLKTNCIAEAISGGYRGSTPNPNRFKDCFMLSSPIFFMLGF